MLFYILIIGGIVCCGISEALIILKQDYLEKKFESINIEFSSYKRFSSKDLTEWANKHKSLAKQVESIETFLTQNGKK